MAQNDEFRRRIAARLKAVSDKIDQVPRAVALGIMNSLVMRSPVDTGRFRSNWVLAVGTIDPTNDAEPTRDALADTQHVIMRCELPAGQTIYLTNSLPYAQRLEYGWSQQAPQGMVRLTVADLPQVVHDAVKTIGTSR